MQNQARPPAGPSPDVRPRQHDPLSMLSTVRRWPCNNSLHDSECVVAKVMEMAIVLHIALVEPEIAPNTGNIARLCAATGSRLHLIGRLGFRLDDRRLRRAGLDYWQEVDSHRHTDWAAFRAANPAIRCIPFSAHAQLPYTQVKFEPGDCLVFGSESRGLPADLLTTGPGLLPAVTIPMLGGKVRSLNLATAVGIALYEAIRQTEGW